MRSKHRLGEDVEVEKLSIELRNFQPVRQFTWAGKEMGGGGGSGGEATAVCARCARCAMSGLYLDRLGRILGDNLEERDDEAQVHPVVIDFLGRSVARLQHIRGVLPKNLYTSKAT